MTTLSKQLPDQFSLTLAQQEYGLKQVSYPDDMALLYKWMHSEHVIPQWQLNEPMDKLSAFFEKMLADDHQRLYLVMLEGKPIGYTEIYEAYRDRLARYYEADKDDLGWHLLLGELSAFGKGHLRAIAAMLNHFIFQNTSAKKIVGEPDKNVKPYAKAAEDFAYIAQGELVMPEKTATLYFCNKDSFYQCAKGYFGLEPEEKQ